jgi:hypothetical protein
MSSSIQPFRPPAGWTGYTAGEPVIFYQEDLDLQASGSTVKNNIVVLHADIRYIDLAETMDLTRAAGIVLKLAYVTIPSA